MILILFFHSKYDKKIIIGISFIFIATLLRIIENVIIYATPNGSPWANLILAPIFFIVMIVLIKKLFEIKLTPKTPVIFGIFLIVLFSLVNNYFAVPSIKTSVDFYLNHNEDIKFKKEVALVDNKVIKIKNNDYIILPEYLVYPFVNKMSYVSYYHIDNNIKILKNKKKIIENAAYALIFKQNQANYLKYSNLPSDDLIKLINQHKTQVFETENLLLFK